MNHSLRAMLLSWLIVLVSILAGSPAGADGNGRVPSNDARARNKAPIAKNDAATTAVDTSVTIPVTANDRDRDGRIARKTVRIIGAGPLHGRAGKRRNGTVVYTPNPGFSGQDTFRYRVKDNRGALSNKARVQVTVLPGTGPVVNVGPVADAGPDRNAVTGLPVILNGSASFDPDGNPLQYSWRFLSVPSASARTSADIVNPASPAPSFTPDVDGDYQLELTVTDGTLSDTDGVVITAAAPGHVPPNADAGSDIVVQLTSPAQTVTLNGSASDDPDDLPNPTLTFQWAFVSIPTGSALTNANITNATSAQASFIPDVLGVYLLQLGVFDGADTGFDQVMVTVQGLPPPPVITSLQEDRGPSQLDGITNDTTPTLSGTAATGIIEVTLYQNGIPVSAVPVSSGAWSHTYSVDLPDDGVYTFTATGKNAAGQKSSHSAGKVMDLKTNKPAPPGINQVGGCVAQASGPDKPLGLVPRKCDPKPCLELNVNDGGTPVDVVVQELEQVSKEHYKIRPGGRTGTYLVMEDSKKVVRINITDPLPPGTYHLTFTVRDVAGNTNVVESVDPFSSLEVMDPTVPSNVPSTCE